MNSSPRRYFVDGRGRRVLVGLTFEETREFELLDHLPSARAEPMAPARAQAERWLALYAKHDGAWRHWMAQSRGQERRPPMQESRTGPT